MPEILYFALELLANLEGPGLKWLSFESKKCLPACSSQAQGLPVLFQTAVGEIIKGVPFPVPVPVYPASHIEQFLPGFF